MSTTTNAHGPSQSQTSGATTVPIETTVHHPCRCPPASVGVGARDVFDGMPLSPPWKSPEGECCEDRISALPDDLLHRVLSLLPAEEAVRTSVLAPRWRYLWKLAPGVRLGTATDEPVSLNAIRKFVDPLLRLRGDSPLETFELRFGENTDGDGLPRVNLWIRHAVACKVQVLKLLMDDNRANYGDPWLPLEDVPLVSRHLTALQLRGVRCSTGFLDFSACPALESLQFERCDLSLATKIVSQSLKSLTITDGSFFSDNVRMEICTPNLVALCLDEFWDKTPVLESMPSLVDAFVRINDDASDVCAKLRHGHQTYYGQHQTFCCQYCDTSNDIAYGGSVLLKGLSEARNLALIGTYDMFIFKWDLRWCPTFSKLKTLLLNENWCVPDLNALACILEHAPNLEKLRLQLFSEEPNHKVEIIGSFSSMDRLTAISEKLEIVEIKCEEVDDIVLKVLHFLCTFGIRFSF